MEWNRCYLSSSSAILFLFLFILTVFSAASASTFISDDIFESRASTGRNLLQTKQACPVNFEFQNYTIITSKCKGPRYPANLCCGAFKEFACPFADYLNDLTNECASTMFSYINLYGKYPPGLFASECREGKLGLACPALPPSQLANANGTQVYANGNQVNVLAYGNGNQVNANGNQIIHSPSLLLTLTVGFSFLLFHC